MACGEKPVRPPCRNDLLASSMRDTGMLKNHSVRRQVVRSHASVSFLARSGLAGASHRFKAPLQ